MSGRFLLLVLWTILSSNGNINPPDDLNSLYKELRPLRGVKLLLPQRAAISVDTTVYFIVSHRRAEGLTLADLQKISCFPGKYIPLSTWKTGSRLGLSLLFRRTGKAFKLSPLETTVAAVFSIDKVY
uniref:Uncharacterized protein n=1 Tax=Opuntia streptacantha TaxID=393608 RepID=A0A7C8ZEQ5_OPUST